MRRLAGIFKSPSHHRVPGVLLAALLAVLGASNAPAVYAATLTVNSTADTTSTDGQCTLREAMINASANSAFFPDCAAGSNAAEDVITFSVSGTITLALALPAITSTSGLVIDGAGAAITISGDNTNRVLQVQPGAKLKLLNLTVANANSSGWGGGVYANGGTLVVGNSTFRNNQVTNGAGGAAIAVASPGSLVVFNSTFTGNTADGACGIYVGSGVTANIVNSTIAGNNCGNGISGAIYNLGTTTLRNTILSNDGARNCYGTITDGGNNIDSGTSCGFVLPSTSQSSTDPLLGLVASNGGPAWTMALQTGSPAINRGNATACAALAGSPTFGAKGTDQRGFARRSGFCDIGAFEAQPASLNVTPGASDQATTINSAFANPLLIHVVDANLNALGGVVVTYTVPASGPSAVLASNPVTSDILGDVSTTAAANAKGGGPYEVSAAASGVNPVTLSFTNNPAPTTTLVISHLPNPSHPGAPVTIVVSVTSNVGTPTDSVTVRFDTSNCTVPVSAGACTFTPTATGPHSIQASYSGNSDFAGSATEVMQHTVEPYRLLLPFVRR